jgi:hypothetical protein
VGEDEAIAVGILGKMEKAANFRVEAFFDELADGSLRHDLF